MSNDPVVIQNVHWSQFHWHEEATRSRVHREPDPRIVREYADAIERGDPMPRPEVWADPDQRGKYFIGDGYHRLHAHAEVAERNHKAAKTTAQLVIAKAIECRVHQHGGRIAAIKHALKANATHGLRRSNADKRRCIEIALAEFPGSSDRVIAELCGVDHKTVGKARAELGNFPTSNTRVGADGKTYPVAERRNNAQENGSPLSEQLDFFARLEKSSEPPSKNDEARVGHFLVWLRSRFPELDIHWKGGSDGSLA